MASWAQSVARRLKVGTHRVSVVDTRALSPKVRVVRLQAQSLVDAGFTPGCKVKLAVAPGAWRSYTPLAWSDAEGYVDILFHLHDRGPGSDWARAAARGQRLDLAGPKRSISTDLGKQPPAWTLFLGDETTLGLAVAVAALTPKAERHGAIEIDPSDAKALAALDLPLAALPRASERGQALLDWLRAFELPEGPGVVWVSGHAGTAKAAATALKARRRRDVVINHKAYWNRPKDIAKGRGLR